MSEGTVIFASAGGSSIPPSGRIHRKRSLLAHREVVKPFVAGKLSNTIAVAAATIIAFAVSDWLYAAAYCSAVCFLLYRLGVSNPYDSWPADADEATD